MADEVYPTNIRLQTYRFIPQTVEISMEYIIIKALFHSDMHILYVHLYMYLYIKITLKNN